MSKKSIAFFEIQDWERDYLQKTLPDHELLFFKNELALKDIQQISNFEIISVFIYSKLSEDVLKKTSSLKMISTRSTGFDHIDMEYCRKQDISVCNVPTYGENTVAEHTFALILSLSRNIHKAYVRTVKTDFSMQGLQGYDLKGRTIGIIGAGHIGLHVIKMANGFGMKVLVYDVVQNPLIAEVLRFDYVSLEELLRQSDIISLHAPYNKHTHHLINKDNIKQIKKSALLINTSRGGLVDTDALVLALDEGILGGAGLDVLEGEDLIKEEKQLLSKNYSIESLKTLLSNHILLNRDNVVITPHIAFNSQEANLRILETTVNNIHSYLEGIPQNTVG